MQEVYPRMEGDEEAWGLQKPGGCRCIFDTHLYVLCLKKRLWDNRAEWRVMLWSCGISADFVSGDPQFEWDCSGLSLRFGFVCYKFGCRFSADLAGVATISAGFPTIWLVFFGLVYTHPENIENRNNTR